MPITWKIIVYAVISGVISCYANVGLAQQEKDIIRELEGDNCQSSTEVTYRSQQLTSPDSRTSVYFEVILRRTGKTGDYGDGDYCYPLYNRKTRKRKIVAANFTSSRNIELPPENEAYVVMKPISFSPDSRYVVIREDYAWNGGDGETAHRIFDTENNYQDLSLYPCQDSYGGGEYEGFISPSEILFSCYEPMSSDFAVVNLEHYSIQRISRKPVVPESVQSYGSVSAEFAVITKQFFPR
ncbi:MAG: hypothetical protein F6J86_32350 [Symploca sp. SIO1B1]|nr:hypothetical protein [Symploca sp. SIO1C2]NER98465.1 hypothetical protein [Symploca sp. SIO1B1]